MLSVIALASQLALAIPPHPFSIGNPTQRLSALEQHRQRLGSFDAMYQYLKQGDQHKSLDAGQRQLRTHHLDGKPFYYTLIPPQRIIEGKRYPAIFYLHGDVTAQRWRRNGRWWPFYDLVKQEEYFQIFPAGWHEARWWSDLQVENLRGILNELKAEYAIDSNRIFLTGLSDGGSGIFYIAARTPDLFALVAPAIGSPTVISSAVNGANQETYPINYLNTRMLIVNGTADRLYPADAIEIYANYFRSLGVDVEFIAVSGSHSYPTFRHAHDLMLAKAASISRNPFPETVVMEVDENTAYRRAHWLVVDKISQPTKENLLKGLMEQDNPRAIVEAQASGNMINVYSYSAEQFTILISPEQFDLNRPLTIYVNREKAFEQLISPDIDTLVEYAAKDMDPARLYAKALKFSVKMDAAN
ncbi:hypothetical protein [Permianibacter aggregans]|uniref:Dienelactone hydrolase domain-containing protein n=1 Tax=Permianibacter aggregans TaxID=1510150 RepID=A0A4R6UE68_9GAMM|nr:hypothetical protein [Permianibacter aggregans]QGX38501.1 hypothetical protein E2H98_01985 [Permianibacter aggregans]TDQ45060.1 hypothetical protein EV696_12119 [Permianibacter aggregans]